MPYLACLIVLGLAACGSSSPANPAPDAFTGGPACTGATYDPCTTNDQCTSLSCHFYQQSAITVCTTTCDATHPCPNDSGGNPVACNGMGNCKPTVVNSCHR